MYADQEAVVTHESGFVEIGQLAVPGMRTKVRWFPGGATRYERWRAPSNILTFSIVLGEPALLRNVSEISSEFRPARPLMFRPRSAVWESKTSGSQMLTVSSYFDGDFLSADDEIRAGAISVDDFSMLEMMQILCEEIRAPGHASAELVAAIGSVLRIKLSRLVQQAVSDCAEQSCSTDVATIRKLIHSGRGGLPTTKELAGFCNTTRRSLLRRVRRATGKSTSQYIAETQLNRAKTLLATSSMTLQQIAYEAGYANPSRFSSKFKSMTGMTPRAFRKSARRHEALLPRGPATREQ